MHKLGNYRCVLTPTSSSTPFSAHCHFLPFQPPALSPHTSWPAPSTSCHFHFLPQPLPLHTYLTPTSFPACFYILLYPLLLPDFSTSFPSHFLPLPMLLTYSFSLLCFSWASASRASACCSLASINCCCRSRRLFILSSPCRWRGGLVPSTGSFSTELLSDTNTCTYST